MFCDNEEGSSNGLICVTVFVIYLKKQTKMKNLVMIRGPTVEIRTRDITNIKKRMLTTEP
jgi:hypothetical protein